MYRERNSTTTWRAILAFERVFTCRNWPILSSFMRIATVRWQKCWFAQTSSILTHSKNTAFIYPCSATPSKLNIVNTIEPYGNPVHFIQKTCFHCGTDLVAFLPLFDCKSLQNHAFWDQTVTSNRFSDVKIALSRSAWRISEKGRRPKLQTRRPPRILIVTLVHCNNCHHKMRHESHKAPKHSRHKKRVEKLSTKLNNSPQAVQRNEISLRSAAKEALFSPAGIYYHLKNFEGILRTVS